VIAFRRFAHIEDTPMGQFYSGQRPITLAR
jgi:hypothetical protein